MCALTEAAEKTSYKGLPSLTQGQEMRCTKGTSKSPQALPSLKHTNLSAFQRLLSNNNKKHPNKINDIEFPACHYWFFLQIRRGKKKTCSKIITSLILTYLIATCWSDNLHAIRDVQHISITEFRKYNPQVHLSFFLGVSTSPTLVSKKIKDLLHTPYVLQ